ncbi:MAG: hypothetical protein OEO17_16610 [Gemmatimonadota bacterium]|nr:hypothetical protein [Gemmatimonadota bacterium]MDH3570779.1 hypothetical protein [Gemmatimonadota bacterium]MDH5550918.1 hypothetical protein [Gemmatimonadota bacterium]
MKAITILFLFALQALYVITMIRRRWERKLPAFLRVFPTVDPALDMNISEPWATKIVVSERWQLRSIVVFLSALPVAIALVLLVAPLWAFALWATAPAASLLIYVVGEAVKTWYFSQWLKQR